MNIYIYKFVVSSPNPYITHTILGVPELVPSTPIHRAFVCPFSSSDFQPVFFVSSFFFIFLNKMKGKVELNKCKVKVK